MKLSGERRQELCTISCGDDELLFETHYEDYSRTQREAYLANGRVGDNFGLKRTITTRGRDDAKRYPDQSTNGDRMLWTNSCRNGPHRHVSSTPLPAYRSALGSRRFLLLLARRTSRSS